MNKVKLTLLSAILIATALAFLACEEKGKKAESAPAETEQATPEEASEAIKECSDTGTLQTAEAMFLETYDGTEDSYISIFRLADGNEIVLRSDGDLVKNLKKGDKASITYKKRQDYDPSDGGSCWDYNALESVKMLSKGERFTDSRDKQEYLTVKIGKQTWMAENLNFKTERSWCSDNDESNCKKYGRLYSLGSAKTDCPSGWHLPDTAEWNILMVAVGGVRKYQPPEGGRSGYLYYDGAGKKLKSKTGWNENGNGTDDYGFSAMPGGQRVFLNGSFSSVGYEGQWWSAPVIEATPEQMEESGEAGDAGYTRYMSHEDNLVTEDYRHGEYGFSVRCVKD